MRKRCACVIGVISVGLILTLLFSSLILKNSDSKLITFTPELWQEQPLERYRMWESLCVQYRNFSQMSRNEIQELLLLDGSKFPKNKLELILEHGLSDKMTIIFFSFDDNEIFAGYNIGELYV